MVVLRVRERVSAIIQRTLEGLAAPDDVVEWEVCTSFVEMACEGSEDDDTEPHTTKGQVLCFWIGLSCPESDATSTCQWIMPLQAATDEFLVESLAETWENLSFVRRAHELDQDLDLGDLARHLDDGHSPGS